MLDCRPYTSWDNLTYTKEGRAALWSTGCSRGWHNATVHPSITGVTELLGAWATKVGCSSPAWESLSCTAKAALSPEPEDSLANQPLLYVSHRLPSQGMVIHQCSSGLARHECVILLNPQLLCGEPFWQKSTHRALSCLR